MRKSVTDSQEKSIRYRAREMDIATPTMHNIFAKYLLTAYLQYLADPKISANRPCTAKGVPKLDL